jgi:D,D-heptose 1,7-bisphosphate phosphatase
MTTRPEGWTIFLDREGTLIHDAGYLKDPHQVRLLPGVGEALAALQRQGFSLVLVSNQSGLARGLITEEQARQVHLRMLTSLAPYGVRLDGAYYCRHHPEAGCRCRKPRPGMLIRAARELGLDLSRAFMIGDKSTDVEAGRQAGCRTILLAALADPDRCDPGSGTTASTWPAILQWIDRQVRTTG